MTRSCPWIPVSLAAGTGTQAPPGCHPNSVAGTLTCPHTHTPSTHTHCRDQAQGTARHSNLFTYFIPFPLQLSTHLPPSITLMHPFALPLVPPINIPQVSYMPKMLFPAHHNGSHTLRGRNSPPSVSKGSRESPQAAGLITLK